MGGWYGHASVCSQPFSFPSSWVSVLLELLALCFSTLLLHFGPGHWQGVAEPWVRMAAANARPGPEGQYPPRLLSFVVRARTPCTLWWWPPEQQPPLGLGRVLWILNMGAIKTEAGLLLTSLVPGVPAPSSSQSCV